MPLPYNVARVLTYFQRSVEIYDIVGAVVDHEVVKVEEPHRTIVGVLIPPTDKDLQLFEEGELASGAMILYVPSTIRLSVADALDDISEGVRQTIVVFDGDLYRIKGQSNRSTDGLHRKYTMVRYLKGR